LVSTSSTGDVAVIPANAGIHHRTGLDVKLDQ
jgi:hypothetical protein